MGDDFWVAFVSASTYAFKRKLNQGLAFLAAAQALFSGCEPPGSAAAPKAICGRVNGRVFVQPLTQLLPPDFFSGRYLGDDLTRSRSDGEFATLSKLIGARSNAQRGHAMKFHRIAHYHLIRNIVPIIFCAIAAPSGGKADTLRMVVQSLPAVGGRCMNVPADKAADGLRVQMWDCNNSPTQTFVYDDQSRELKLGEKCLESLGAGKAKAKAKDPVGISSCNGRDNQKWSIVPSKDVYQIVSANGLCLDITKAVANNGTPLDVYPCAPENPVQLWVLTEAPEVASANGPGTNPTQQPSNQTAAGWPAATASPAGDNGSGQAASSAAAAGSPAAGADNPGAGTPGAGTPGAGAPATQASAPGTTIEGAPAGQTPDIPGLIGSLVGALTPPDNGDQGNQPPDAGAQGNPPPDAGQANNNPPAPTPASAVPIGCIQTPTGQQIGITLIPVSSDPSTGSGTGQYCVSGGPLDGQCGQVFAATNPTLSLQFCLNGNCSPPLSGNLTDAQVAPYEQPFFGAPPNSNFTQGACQPGSTTAFANPSPNPPTPSFGVSQQMQMCLQSPDGSQTGLTIVPPANADPNAPMTVQYYTSGGLAGSMNMNMYPPSTVQVCMNGNCTPTVPASSPATLVNSPQINDQTYFGVPPNSQLFPYACPPVPQYDKLRMSTAPTPASPQQVMRPPVMGPSQPVVLPGPPTIVTAIPVLPPAVIVVPSGPAYSPIPSGGAGSPPVSSNVPGQTCTVPCCGNKPSSSNQAPSTSGANATKPTGASAAASSAGSPSNAPTLKPANSGQGTSTTPGSAVANSANPPGGLNAATATSSSGSQPSGLKLQPAPPGSANPATATPSGGAPGSAIKLAKPTNSVAAPPGGAGPGTVTKPAVANAVPASGINLKHPSTSNQANVASQGAQSSQSQSASHPANTVGGKNTAALSPAGQHVTTNRSGSRNHGATRSGSVGARGAAARTSYRPSSVAHNVGHPSFGGGHGGFGGGGKHFSDQRLKEDIVQLDRLDNGIGVYRFRYKGNDRTVYVGVIAQDVARILPSAVTRDRSGYLLVDYDQLGIGFMSWNELVARKGAKARWSQ